MTEVEKLHGLHNTGLTMHERFTLLARQGIGRRGRPNPLQGRSPRVRGKGRTNPALIEAIINQLNQAQRPIPEIPFRNRGRGRGELRRYGSEGSLRSHPGFRRERSNSFGHINQGNKNQKWRRSNGNLSNLGGSMNGSVHNGSNAQFRGYWQRGDGTQFHARGRARGQGRGQGTGFRGRFHQNRVIRVSESVDGARPARGSGRRGMRRNVAGPARGRGRGWGNARGRGRGRGGISRVQTPKPVPTREQLDAQLDQYMAGTKAALDKELDDYMRHAMDFE